MNVDSSFITKSGKHQRKVGFKYFFEAKILSAKNHYKKPTQEKPPAENIIYVGTNNSSSDKKPMSIANDQLRLMQTEQLSLIFYQGKTSLIAKPRKSTYICKLYFLEITWL